MDELNGRMIACQLLITGLIARVANNSPDPLRFLTDFRDEIRAVVGGINIAGMDNTDRVRQTAQKTIDELFSAPERPDLRALPSLFLERFQIRFRTISILRLESI